MMMTQGMISPRTTLLIPSAGNLCHTACLVQAEFLMVGPSSLPWLLGHLTEHPGDTGGKGWCSHLGHCKHITRKWTKYQPNTHPGYCKYIHNISGQFPCNIPTMENLEYFCNVPSSGIAVSQSNNWWEHSKGSQRMCPWCFSMECLRCSLWFPNWWDCDVTGQ